jgi:hypothetical protein
MPGKEDRMVMDGSAAALISRLFLLNQRLLCALASSQLCGQIR